MKERKGKALSMRISAALYEKIVARTSESGRSVTHEVEILLEGALRAESIETKLDQILDCIKPVRRVA